MNGQYPDEPEWKRSCAELSTEERVMQHNTLTHRHTPHTDKGHMTIQRFDQGTIRVYGSTTGHTLLKVTLIVVMRHVFKGV